MMAATYEGTPCKKAGHTTRYLKGYSCVKCQCLRFKEDYQNIKEHRRMVQKTYYKNNKTKMNAYSNKCYNEKQKSRNQTAVIKIMQDLFDHTAQRIDENEHK